VSTRINWLELKTHVAQGDPDEKVIHNLLVRALVAGIKRRSDKSLPFISHLLF
jgi:hypothetical protein